MGDTLGIEDGKLGDELRSSHLPKIAHTKEAKIEINAPITLFYVLSKSSCVAPDLRKEKNW